MTKILLMTNKLYRYISTETYNLYTYPLMWVKFKCESGLPSSKCTCTQFSKPHWKASSLASKGAQYFLLLVFNLSMLDQWSRQHHNAATTSLLYFFLLTKWIITNLAIAIERIIILKNEKIKDTMNQLSLLAASPIVYEEMQTTVKEEIISGKICFQKIAEVKAVIVNCESPSDLV